MTLAPPLPQLPDSFFERRASVLANGHSYSLSRLTIDGRKLAWKARKHPMRKGNLVQYIPARQLNWWELALGALFLGSIPYLKKR